MKKITLIIALFLGSTACFGQTANLGEPRGFIESDHSSVTFHELPKQNNATLLEAELARRVSEGNKVVNFGTYIEHNVSVIALGNKKTLANGDVLTRYGIQSTSAESINLIFSDFFLSRGTTLYVYNDSKTLYVGAYTSINNNVSNTIGTEILNGDKCIIEVYEPKNEVGQSRLNLSQVIHGYEPINTTWKAFESSGNCEYDVNCAIGAGWENQRNSAIMLVSGGGFCSAALVNNTSGTLIPYVLTADHCGPVATTWIFRFRWEAPTGGTVCGIAGVSTNGPQTMNVNNCVARASWAPSDMILCEMNSLPNPAWGIYYNGWDNSGATPTSVCGVHHPAGDLMKISFDNTPCTSADWGGGTTPNSHWYVPSWDQGVTEGGSSGSPLFDQNHRIVGQLHGGASVCGGSNLSDLYGKLSVSWIGGATNSSRLSNWLDPGTTGATFIDGVDPSGPGVALDGSVQSPAGATGIICGTTVTPTFILSNPGTTVLTSATITYGYDGSLSQTYPWVGSLAQFGTTTITLPAQILSNGAHTFGALLTQINGGADPVATNNAVNSSMTIIANARVFDLSLTLDCYGDETTWEAKDNGVVLASGGPYTNSFTAPATITDNFCVSDTCFTFTIYDSFGDGFTGDGACAFQGSATLTNDLGTVVMTILTSEAGMTTFNGDSIVKTTACSFLGLNEQTTLNGISLYPNPTKDNFTITFGEIEGDKSVVIMDASGKVLQTLESSITTLNVPLNKYAKGIYFVQIKTINGNYMQRVIKE